MSTRKPKGNRFRRWVTGEVLPDIRRAGKWEAARVERDYRSVPPNIRLLKQAGTDRAA